MIYAWQKLCQVIVCSHWSRLGWRLVYVSRETPVFRAKMKRCEYYLTIINDDFFIFRENQVHMYIM